MTDDLRISVCIPTYKRPDLLAEALNSCLAQTYLPYEILIGDNSPDSTTKELVAQWPREQPVIIKHFHHVPGLNQAGNVDFLFQQAQGELLLLLHDDDTLTPDCLQKLRACFVEHPDIDVAVGKQYIMSNEGVVDYKASEVLNPKFYRAPEYAGTKLSPLEAVIVQQFPNDCFMLRTAIAQKLGYKGATTHACDFEFGLKLGIGNYKIFYLDEYVAYYRLSATALTRNRDNNGSLVIYKLVEALDLPKESQKYRTGVLSIQAPIAIAQAANLKLPREASRIFFSRWHLQNLFSKTGAKGIYHMIRSFF